MNTVALVALFALAVVGASWWITGRLGEQPLESGERDPVHQITLTDDGVDVSRLTLPVAVRGYRMAEVDATIAQLADIIAKQQAQLRGEPQQPSDSAS